MTDLVSTTSPKISIDMSRLDKETRDALTSILRIIEEIRVNVANAVNALSPIDVSALESAVTTLRADVDALIAAAFTLPIAIADVTSLQTTLTDLQDQITAFAAAVSIDMLVGGKALGITQHYESGTGMQTDINTILSSQGLSLLPVNDGNTYADTVGSHDIVLTNTLEIPPYAVFVSFNTYLYQNYTVATGVWKPTVAFGPEDGGNVGIVPFQRVSRGYVWGLTIVGPGYGAAGASNDRIIGMRTATRDITADPTISYIGGHACLDVRCLTIQGFYVGLHMMAVQYSLYENIKANNNYIGVLDTVMGHRSGGMVDAPKQRHFMLHDNIVGRIIVRSPASLPVSPYGMDVFWSKNSKCSLAIVNDPNYAAASDDWHEVHIDEGSIEYNECGRYGIGKTYPVKLPSYDDSGWYDDSPPTPCIESYWDEDIPGVEIYVQERNRCVVKSWDSQSNIQPSGGGDLYSGFGCAVLLEDNAVIEIGRMGGQRGMAVRCLGPLAQVQFLGGCHMLQGCVENVEVWPTHLVYDTMLGQSGLKDAVVFCGFGDMTAVSNAADLLYFSDASGYNFGLSSVKFTNTMQPEFHENTEVGLGLDGVTFGHEADTDGNDSTGEDVGYFVFPDDNPDAQAETFFLMGGASSRGIPDTTPCWQLVQVMLKNTTDSDLRIHPFIWFQGYGFQRGADPASRDLTTETGVQATTGEPAAVTLYPHKWQRVAIAYDLANDNQFAIRRQNQLDAVVKVRCKKIAHSIAFSVTDRKRIDDMLKHGQYVLRS